MMLGGDSIPTFGGNELRVRIAFEPSPAVKAAEDAVLRQRLDRMHQKRTSRVRAFIKSGRVNSVQEPKSFLWVFRRMWCPDCGSRLDTWNYEEQGVKYMQCVGATCNYYWMGTGR